MANLLQQIGGWFTEDEEEKKRRQKFQASVSNLFGKTTKEVSNVGTSLAKWTVFNPKQEEFALERAKNAPLLSLGSVSNLAKDVLYGDVEQQKRQKEAQDIISKKLNRQPGLSIGIGGTFLTKEEQKKFTPDELKKIQQVRNEQTAQQGMMLMGGGLGKSENKLLDLASKRLKMSPTFIAEEVQRGADPLLKSVGKLLTTAAKKELTEESYLGLSKKLISLTPEKPGIVSKVLSPFRKTYTYFIDRFKPITDIEKKAVSLGAKPTPVESPGIMARNYLGMAESAEQRISYRTFEKTPTGINWTGEGLQDIVNDTAPYTDDFRVYLVANHLDEVSPKVEQKMPQMKAVFQGALDEIKKKYTPDQLLKFEQTAQRLYDYQKRVLKETLVDTGMMSQELYDTLTRRYPRYIPLNRVVDDLASQGAIPKTENIFQPKTLPIKRIKGSELQVIDPIESIIGNTYIFSEVGERNRVTANIAKLAEDIPALQEEIHYVSPKVVPTGTAIHKEVIDPTLYEGLVQFASDIKATVTTKLKMGKLLGKAFITDPPEVRRMFGSRESTLAHEIGHVIDGPNGVLRDLLVKDKVTNVELRKLADSRYGNMEVTKYFKSYVRKGEEKVAELVSLYTTNRPMARRLAPNAVKKLEEFLSLDPQLSGLRKLVPTNVETMKQMEERIFSPSMIQPKGVLTVFRNGQKRYLKVPDPLYEAMTGMAEEGSNTLIKLLSQPARILRAGATLSPEFSTTNPVRDQWSAFFNAKYGYMPFWDFSKALFDLAGNKEVYHRWLAAGGGHSQFVAMDRAFKNKTATELVKKAEDTGGGKVISKLSEFKKYLNPLEDLRVLSMSMENPTRLGIFKNAAKTQGDFIAAFESREASTDFGRRGAKMKAYNMITAFFNANLQHREKMLRSIKEKPLQSLAKVLPFSAISAALWYVNRDDPRYAEIDPWKKNLFWIVMLPNKAPGPSYLMIPKGDIGIVFGTPVEAALEWLDKNEPNTSNALLKEMVSQVLPVQNVGALLPTGLRVPVELYANKSFFTGINIIPQSREDLIAAEQFSPGTSEVFKWVGKKLNMSPAQLEYFFTGYTATLGRTFTDLSDTALSKLGVIDPTTKLPPTLPGEDIPIIGGLVRRWIGREPIGSSSVSMARFYDETTRLDSLYKTANKYLKEGRKDEVAALIKANPDIALAKDFVKLRNKYADIRDLKDNVITNKELTEEEKRGMLRELDLYLTDLSQIAMQLLDSTKTGKPISEQQRRIPSLEELNRSFLGQ